MPKKIVFLKMTIKEAVEQGAVSVAVPMISSDIEQFNKLGSPFRATITKSRNLMHHRKFFAICNMMVDNGILDIIPIEKDVLNKLLSRFKNESYVLVYILKYVFLPLEQKVLPNGAVIEDVSSISFDEMDQDDFKKFYDDCIQYFCDNMQITKEQIERNMDYEKD